MADQIIVVKTLIRTGERSPSQWEAETSDGRHLYVRYRWGLLEIGIGQSATDAVEHSGNLFEKQLGHKLDGSMELEELREATKGLIEWPNTYENHPAEFQAVDFTPAAIGSLDAELMRRGERMEHWFAVEHLDVERLLAEWRWLCPGRMTLVARNAFADLFLRNEAGHVLRLEVGVARLRKVADSEAQFRDLAQTGKNREEWFAEADEKAAAGRGLTPSADQCIGFQRLSRDVIDSSNSLQ